MRPPRRRTGLGVVSAVGLIYCVTLALLPRDGFWINDNGCKFIQARALVENGFRDFALAWPGRELDRDYEFNPLPSPFGHLVADVGASGSPRLYGTFSVVFAALSAVAWQSLGSWGLYLLPLAGGVTVLAGVWSLVGALGLPNRVRRIARPVGALLVALVTPVWFYSVTFWEHVPAVACTTWAAAAVIVPRAGSRRLPLIVAGALAALATWFRDDCYLFAVALAAAMTMHREGRWTRIGLFACSFLAAALPFWAFQWAAIGDPIGYHLRSGSILDHGLWLHLRDRFDVAALLVFNNHTSAWLSGFVSLVPLVLLLGYPRLRGKRLARYLAGLSVLAIAGGAIVFHGLFAAESPVWSLQHGNGLFAASPVLALGLLHVRRQRRSRTCKDRVTVPDAHVRVARLILIYVTGYILLAPEAHVSGIHWGCRYLLPAIPLLGALAASTLGHAWVRFRGTAHVARTMLILAVAVSFALQLFSLGLLYGRKSFSARLNRIVREAPEEVVVATDWFVPQDLAPNFFEKRIFLVRHPGKTESLARMLRGHGIDRVLRVVWKPRHEPAEPDPAVLDDGWLRFVSLRIETVAVPAPAHDP